jgi:hypothetical protein
LHLKVGAVRFSETQQLKCLIPDKVMVAPKQGERDQEDKNAGSLIRRGLPTWAIAEMSISSEKSFAVLLRMSTMTLFILSKPMIAKLEQASKT